MRLGSRQRGGEDRDGRGRERCRGRFHGRRAPRFSTTRRSGRSRSRCSSRSALIAFVAWIANNTIANLRRANIASGFGFLWNRAGFDIVAVADPLLGRVDLWPRAPRRVPQHAARRRPRHRASPRSSASSSASRGCRRTGCSPASPRSMSRPSATSRCCCSFSSGTRRCSRSCPVRGRATRCRFGANLSNRGLLLPRPIVGAGFAATAIAFLVAIVAGDRRSPSGRAAGSWRPGGRSRPFLDRPGDPHRPAAPRLPRRPARRLPSSFPS